MKTDAIKESPKISTSKLKEEESKVNVESISLKENTGIINNNIEENKNIEELKNISIKEEEEKKKEEESINEEEYLEKLIEEKNAKYADYPDLMVELINKIRENPTAYADVIEDSIKYIIEEPDKKDETKTKLVFKKKVKVALKKGKSAFLKAAGILRKMEPMPPLEFNGYLCIPLPQSEEEMKDPNYLEGQIKTIKESHNVDVFFKDLIKLPEVSVLLMIVDDTTKNPGKKRNALLNKDFKYIGINSHFIGKNFLAYFAFSKEI